MTPKDNAIKATLTSQPQYIPEWDEYAAVADDGALYTAEDPRKCAELVQEANALIASHKRRAADGWAQYEQAAQQARESVDALLAEIKENNHV